ncbi:hypothetical protein LPW26_03360 [Rhodopseudomonas sp. HC1]|uniref:hypothetical protein n=1 Tax=Rhodopseudomonas infernalis TaxID=2897386 RepID=UPI001EE7A24A|nr:hypothetical protein [Rhodopseudomonas infernalis]MCG6203664.1 hypothetical protein [Rhodopseudomonas infernalis]
MNTNTPHQHSPIGWLITYASGAEQFVLQKPTVWPTPDCKITELYDHPPQAAGRPASQPDDFEAIEAGGGAPPILASARVIQARRIATVMSSMDSHSPDETSAISEQAERASITGSERARLLGELLKDEAERLRKLADEMDPPATPAPAQGESLILPRRLTAENGAKAALIALSPTSHETDTRTAASTTNCDDIRATLKVQAATLAKLREWHDEWRDRMRCAGIAPDVSEAHGSAPTPQATPSPAPPAPRDDA